MRPDLGGPGVALLALAAAVGASAQEPVPLTLESMNRTVSVRDPQFSPDGREIVFVSNRSGRSKLWIVDREDGDLALGESAVVWTLPPMPSARGSCGDATAAPARRAVDHREFRSVRCMIWDLPF